MADATRPTASREKTPGGYRLLLFIPNDAIDNQSHALTHDQLKHLTGNNLQQMYRERRQQLEMEVEGG